MLKVNEIFGPTIQGEGKSIGRDVMFVRLAHCNLHCIWCDTPYTWNWLGTSFAHPDKFDKANEVHEMSVQDVLARLDGHIKALVISGGEPLLQQRQLVELLTELRKQGYWIEIETNGTIEPLDSIMCLVDQINCSPKLSNSGDPLVLRQRDNALMKLSASDKVSFKFVVSYVDDIDEILSYVEKYNMREVYLMPEGRTRDELTRHRDMTQKLCKVHGFKFTERLHIVRFGTRRGV